MANSYRCKHCGYQQGTHEIDPTDFQEKLPGYHVAVTDCPGFEMDKADKKSYTKANKGQKVSASISHTVPTVIGIGTNLFVVDMGG